MMFIQKLFRYNKTLFFFFILFIFAFVIINVKWGFVSTPVYQFGMFSGKYKMNEPQDVYIIYADSKPLNISSYHFAERDMLRVSLENYEVQEERNAGIYKTIKHLFSSAGLDKLFSEFNYRNHISPVLFDAWYKKLLKNITGMDVKQLSISRHKYTWNDLRYK